MNKPFVIGIAGGSASGKSTLADALAKAFDEIEIFVLRMDHYFKPSEQLPRPKAPVTGVVYEDHNHPSCIDLPRLKRDLDQVIAGGAYKIIIVEGLFTLWDDAIQDRLGLKIYVECGPAERIVRRLRRNMEWGLTFDEISDVYLDLVRYRHDEFIEATKWRADMIYNGSNPSEKSLEMIATYVKHSLKD